MPTARCVSVVWMKTTGLSIGGPPCLPSWQDLDHGPVSLYVPCMIVPHVVVSVAVSIHGCTCMAAVGSSRFAELHRLA